MRRLSLAMLLVVLWSSGAYPEANPPTLPTPVDFATTQAGPPGFSLLSTCTAANSAAFASCLSTATGGTKIVLTHGVTYTGPFTLGSPAPSGGQVWVWVTTDDATLPAPGTRVTASDSTKMPFVTVSACGPGNYPITAAANANHWWLTGLNVGVAAGACPSPNILGAPVVLQVGTSYPNHIAIDRCLLHGDATNGASQGLQAIAPHLALFDSRVSDIFKDPNGESHGLLFPGHGPYLIRNNYIEADAINVFFSEPDVTGAIPVSHDITIIGNHITKPLKWNTGAFVVKNLYESKGAFRVDIENNRFENSFNISQPVCIQLASTRVSGSGNTDITFAWNYVKNCPIGMGVTVRPAQGDPTIIGVANNGSGLIRLTVSFGQSRLWATGDTAIVSNIGGSPTANGTWTITFIDDASGVGHVDLQASSFGSGYSASGNIAFFSAGTNTNKLAIHDNLFEDIEAAAVSGGTVSAFLQTNHAAVLTPNGGASDAALSTTGSWGLDDFAFYHNTVVGPTAGNLLGGFQKMLPTGPSAPWWKAARWTVRDNISLVGPNGSLGSIASGDQLTTAYGTTAMDIVTDPVTRVFKNNVWFKPVVASDFAFYSGNDAAALAVLTDETGVGFTSYVAGTVTNYKLVPVFSGTCTTDGTINVSCTTAPPTAVVSDAGHGATFKVTGDPDSTYRQITAVSGTTLTLASAYPNSQTSVASKISFENWSSDCTARALAGLSCDPGVDTATLNTRLSGGSGSSPSAPTGLHFIP